MRFSPPISLIVLLLFFAGEYLRAQSIPDDFRALTDSVILAGPVTYRDLDAPLRPFRRDTLLMNYFIREAKIKGYYDGLAYAYNQLGTRFRNISEYEKALEYHENGLQAANDADNVEFKIFSLNMIAVVYRRQDAIKTALDFNQEALELADNIEEPSIGIQRSLNVSLNSIGNIYQALKQYEKAIEHYQRSYVLEKSLSNARGMAVNLQNMGECLEAQGKLNDALEDFREALELDKQINSERGIAICNNSIAQIYIKQNRVPEAIEILKPTLANALALKDAPIISAIYNNLGWASLLSGQTSQAETHLNQALQLSQSNNLLRDKARTYSLLSELETKRQNHKKALEFYKLANEIDNEITNEVNLNYVNDVIIRYDMERQSRDLEMLAQSNEIISLKLKRNENTLLLGALFLALFSLILYILYRQYQLNSEKKVLTLEQSMLRSQMNPHFLFNSLNSIKLYIINNEQKNAVHYLNKFSKLVRKILDASSLKEIPLEEELETVELYMNIENIRFNHEIDFKINIDDSIDPHQIKIPSLVLQPFLENALWHGLSSKEGPKEITLDITRESQKFIKISITDNGIGREAAEKLKERKILKRKSVGINITKERLANFSRDYQNNFSLEMVDLTNTDGSPGGTRIDIMIPTI